MNDTSHCNPFSRQNSLCILETAGMVNPLVTSFKRWEFLVSLYFCNFPYLSVPGTRCPSSRSVFLPVEPRKVSSMKPTLSAAPCAGLHTWVTFFLSVATQHNSLPLSCSPPPPPSLDLFNFTMGLCRNVRLALAKAFWWPLSPIIIVTNKSLKMTVTLQAWFQWLAASSAV